MPHPAGRSFILSIHCDMKRSSEKWLYFFNILVSRFVNAGKRPENTDPADILIIKWDEIGDLMTATHVFALLRKRYPNAKIELITKPWGAGLVQHDPNLDAVHSDLRAWNRSYGLHVELRGTWSTLWKTFRHMPGYRLDRGLVRYRQRGAQPHESVTNYRIIEPVLKGLPMQLPGLFVAAAERQTVKNWLEQRQAGRYVVFHAGARSLLRRWPAARFAAVADHVREKHGLTPVFTGTPDEQSLIAEIAAAMKTPPLVFADGQGLPELAALIEGSRAFVGNESGPLQLADALGKPLIGLFGPGVREVFYPKNPHAVVLHEVLDCNPCDQVHCVRPEQPCIQLLETGRVMQALDDLLAAHVEI